MSEEFIKEVSEQLTEYLFNCDKEDLERDYDGMVSSFFYRLEEKVVKYREQ